MWPYYTINMPINSNVPEEQILIIEFKKPWANT